MSQRVIIVKGKVRWFYHLVSKNGNILTTSQKYWSKGNAKRAAKTLAKNIKAKFVDHE